MVANFVEVHAEFRNVFRRGKYPRFGDTQFPYGTVQDRFKGAKKGSPYSITERRVPELIPVLGSQPAGDVSHKPGGRLPLLRQACSYPATLKRAATSFAAW